MNSVRVPSEQGLPYKVDYEDLISAKHIWETRRLLQASLGGRSEIGDYADFRVRLVRVKGQPRVVQLS
jgi:hypothetical protein